MGANSFTGGGGTTYNTRPRTVTTRRTPTGYAGRSAASYVTEAERNRAAGHTGTTSQTVTGAQVDATNRAVWDAFMSGNAAGTTPRPPINPGGPTRSGSGGGGGGGGGLGQEQLDWLSQLLAAGRPDAVQATNLDLPDYQGMAVRAFDPSGFDQMRQQWAGAVGSDRAAAQQAYGQLGDYLTSNYKNAFAQGAPQTQGPGMDQAAMARMLQSQGANPALNAANVQGQAAGNAAFSNLWQLLGANEDTAQGNRLRRNQIDQNNTMRMLDLASQQGGMQLNQAQSQALAAWQQRSDERAYQDYQMQQQLLQQEAMQNWQRGNQVTDTNASNTNSYNNATLQALLEMLPGLGGLNLPSPESLGL